MPCHPWRPLWSTIAWHQCLCQYPAAASSEPAAAPSFCQLQNRVTHTLFPPLAHRPITQCPWPSMHFMHLCIHASRTHLPPGASNLRPQMLLHPWQPSSACNIRQTAMATRADPTTRPATTSPCTAFIGELCPTNRLLLPAERCPTNRLLLRCSKPACPLRLQRWLRPEGTGGSAPDTPHSPGGLTQRCRRGALLSFEAPAANPLDPATA